MVVRFIDLRLALNGNRLIYPLDRVEVVPGKDIIIGRGPDCDINIFPRYLDETLSEKTKYERREDERRVACRQQPTNFEEIREYYRRCSRRHLAYSPSRRGIKALDTTNGTQLQRAKRDDQDNPTGEYENPRTLPPGKFARINDGDIIYAGGVVLLFEDKRD